MSGRRYSVCTTQGRQIETIHRIVVRRRSPEVEGDLNRAFILNVSQGEIPLGLGRMERTFRLAC